MADAQFIVVVTVFFGLCIAVFLATRTLDPLDAALVDASCTKPVSRPAMPQECNDACMLFNENMHQSFLFTQQWQLPENDSGAFTFDACAPRGGLVVYLTDMPNNETMADSQGYAIVLGDQAGQVRSYVGKLPHFVLVDPRSSLSRINYNFQMNNDPTACQTYWVIYSHGQVMVGVGNDAGENTLICCLRGDEYPPQGVRYFGFGCLRKEDIGIRVRNIKTYDAPPGGCDWLSFAKTKCSDLNAMGDVAAVVGSG